MSAHALLNLLNELGKSYQMRGLLSILSLFRNESKILLFLDIKINKKKRIFGVKTSRDMVQLGRVKICRNVFLQI